MIRGCTSMQVWRIKTNPNNFEKMVATYSQGNKTILTKDKNDFRIEQDTVDNDIWYVMCEFTQEDTLKFSRGMAHSQLKVKSIDGQVAQSGCLNFNVYDTNNEVKL